MRLICVLLLLANVAMLVWRLGFGLPNYFNGEAVPALPQKMEVGQRLSLLSESPRQDHRSVAAERLTRKCQMVGPFGLDAEASALIERLAALDVVATLRPRDELVEEGFRVYFPAEPNRDAARQVLSLLQSRGFDSYIIPSGELENGISLGLFKKRSSADARIAELRRFDYKPLVQVITRVKHEPWIIVTDTERQKISDALWQSLLSSTPPLQVKEILCLDVASH